MIRDGIGLNKRKVGYLYETAAVKYLEDLGYCFVDKNFWTENGEIDLIFIKDETLYLVEVKYRSSEAFGSPRQAITYKKKSNMKKSALHYLKSNQAAYRSFAISFLGITKEENNLNFDFLENIFE